MKKSLKSYKKLLKAVEKYADGRGKGNQPLIELDARRRVDNKQWMGNAIMATYNIKRNRLDIPNKNSSYCSGTFWSQHYRKSEYIFIQVQDIFPDMDPVAFWAYIEWIVNESPWASAFITKNVNTIKRRKVVVMKPNLPVWFAKEAAIALRQCWENYYNTGVYKQVGLWYDLSQSVDKRIAYIAARPLTKITDGKVMLKDGDAGHTPINLYISEPASHRSYSGWTRNRKYAGGWDTRRPNKVIDAIVKVIREGPGSNNANVNPFGGRVGGFPVLNRDTFIDRISKGSKEIEDALNA